MWLTPDWPAPASVVALSTTRSGFAGFKGASTGPYEGFNLGDHVADSPEAVAENRDQLLGACAGLASIGWLNQVHGTDVVTLAQSPVTVPSADASISKVAGLGCGVLTADCVPVLFCCRDGTQVAAAHAGWRGLCAGVLTNTVQAFNCSASDVLAWIGPAISQAHFEVGAEVYRAFKADFAGPASAEIDSAFKSVGAKSGHYHADLYALAKAQLLAVGVGWVGGAQRCTFAEADEFYSFRRDGITGRQLSLIYIKP
ncbi:MAG: peptidoglycan editing factor PgeF [Zhongshania sp.]|uniref:peptidoglycan editing factor PgeF n=1 Tax=Zhongshania sp. TaxID=1971902 RepID=UPI002636A9D8|nr:peptidoglycan editing factor PgeF [Zhongshania sp.]MDF1691191.1 peptidoglycan editing factor PgeF [Zhongshania sp.]